MLSGCDALFRTLGDPTRRGIFEHLCGEGEQTVGALTARAGVSQPAVSKHLGILRQPGWCSTGRTGGRRITARGRAPWPRWWNGRGR